MSSKITMIDVAAALEKVRGAPVLTSNQCHDLAQALNVAAPVVDRQPYAWVRTSTCSTVPTFSTEPPTHHDLALARGMGGKFDALFTAPPELAELQATIAQLRIDLSNKTELTNQANHHKAQRGQTIDELAAEIERLKAESFESLYNDAIDEIERLKGGQGESFGWFTDDHVDDKSATTYTPAVAERWKAKGWPVTPLYTSQPAPVSVSLPTDDDAENAFEHSKFHGHDVFFAGFYAAIDKVKELNQ